MTAHIKHIVSLLAMRNFEKWKSGYVEVCPWVLVTLGINYKEVDIYRDFEA